MGRIAMGGTLELRDEALDSGGDLILMLALLSLLLGAPGAMLFGCIAIERTQHSLLSPPMLIATQLGELCTLARRGRQVVLDDAMQRLLSTLLVAR